jgi:hypothetical protein
MNVTPGSKHVMPIREQYLRGGEVYNTFLTGIAIERIADWLDIADSKTRTSVYPDLPESESEHELALSWCWAALLIANMVDADSRALRELGTAIKLINKQE